MKNYIATFKQVKVSTDKWICVEREDGIWVYLDKYGREKLVLPKNVKSADDFSDGVAHVSFEGKDAYIDESGKVILELPEGTCGYGFVNGIARVFNREKREYGYINIKGQKIITLPASEAKFAYDFSDGRALIERHKAKDGKSKFAFIDEAGCIAIEPNDDVYLATSFRNGIASLKHTGKDDTWTDCIDINGNPVDKTSDDAIKEKPAYVSEALGIEGVALKDIDGLYMLKNDIRSYTEAVSEDKRYIVKVPPEYFEKVAHILSEQTSFFGVLSGGDRNFN